MVDWKEMCAADTPTHREINGWSLWRTIIKNTPNLPLTFQDKSQKALVSGDSYLCQFSANKAALIWLGLSLAYTSKCNSRIMSLGFKKQKQKNKPNQQWKNKQTKNKHQETSTTTEGKKWRHLLTSWKACSRLILGSNMRATRIPVQKLLCMICSYAKKWLIRRPEEW